MVSASIILKEIDDVKEFINLASKSEYDIDVYGGRYVVDGKSIMGLFSLNLSAPILVKTDDLSFITALEKFMVSEAK